MDTPINILRREVWEILSKRLVVEKEAMNTMVMDFLVIEGYADAAEKFQMESGTVPKFDFAMITDRMALVKAVQCGNVEDVVKKVNDLNPEILNTNPGLLFHLQQQTFIELIRHEKIEMALGIAQMQLAPIGEENESLLEEFERTLSLLAFEDVSNCPVRELLEDSQRLKTASELNAAILYSQHAVKGLHAVLKTASELNAAILNSQHAVKAYWNSKGWLHLLLQKLMWVQTQLDEKLGSAYPRISDIWSARLEDPLPAV